MLALVMVEEHFGVMVALLFSVLQSEAILGVRNIQVSSLIY